MLNNKKLQLIQEATTAFPGTPVNSAIWYYLKDRFTGITVAELISKYLRDIRWVYNFDGVDDRGQLQFRAINPDGDNTFEFWTPSDFTLNVAIISQNVATAGNLREFQFGVDAGGLMYIGFGGTYTTVFTSAQGLKPSTKYGVTLIGTQFSIYEGGLLGQLVRQAPFTKGTAREPAAVTLIGCRGNGAGSYGQFFNGPQYDVRINGTLYPMRDRNQDIQLPSPSGLGPELITQAVLENPATIGTQWAYLGNGRWQLNSNGTYSGLSFITPTMQPEAGFVEFEIESISGGSIRCSEGTGGLVANSQFNTIGIKRWYFVQKSLDNRLTFSRNNAGVPVTAVIKNISFKPLWVANAAELLVNGTFNTDTTSWSAINSTVAWSSGTLRVDVAAGVNGGANQNLPMLTAGKYYLLTATVAEVGPSANASVVALRQAAGSFAVLNSASVTAAGSVSFVFMATASDAQISLRSANASAASYCRFDNVSVRELDSLCNPLTLTNTASTGWREIQP